MMCVAGRHNGNGTVEGGLEQSAVRDQTRQRVGNYMPGRDGKTQPGSFSQQDGRYVVFSSEGQDGQYFVPRRHGTARRVDNFMPAWDGETEPGSVSRHRTERSSFFLGGVNISPPRRDWTVSTLFLLGGMRQNYVFIWGTFVRGQFPVLQAGHT